MQLELRSIRKHMHLIYTEIPSASRLEAWLTQTQQRSLLIMFWFTVQWKTALFASGGHEIERRGRHAETGRHLNLWEVVLEQDLGQRVVVDAVVHGERHLPRECRVEFELLAARRKHEGCLNALARDLLVLYSITINK